MSTISIVLQSVAFVVNLSWKYLFSYKGKDSRYWNIMALDGVLLVAITSMQGLYALTVYESWATIMALLSKYIWDNRARKYLEYLFNTLVCVGIIITYVLFGFTFEYFAALCFVICFKSQI